jgi:hypothetical protein
MQLWKMLPPESELPLPNAASSPVAECLLRGRPVGEYTEKGCSICLERYENNTNPAMLYVCGHAFHLQCAETWRLKSRSCPLCWRDLIEKGISTVIPDTASLISSEENDSVAPSKDLLKPRRCDRESFSDMETIGDEVGLISSQVTAPNSARTKPKRRCCLCLFF